MRKIVYLFLGTWMLVSCAHSNKEAMSDVGSEMDDLRSNESEILEETLPTFSHQDLATQKLQDYFDLHLLKQSHPEFEGDIESQLRKLSETNLNIPEGEQLQGVENIQQKGASLESPNNKGHISFYFDLITNKATYKDSITAVLKITEVEIDGEQLTSTKISFQKNN